MVLSRKITAAAAATATSMAGPALLAFSSAVHAEGSGFYGDTSLSYSPDDKGHNFRGSVLQSAFKPKTREFVPPSIAFEMTSTACADADVGYRWNWGNKIPGSVSYTFSLSAGASVCDSTMSADLEFVKAYILDRIEERVRSVIAGEIDDLVSPELRNIAMDLGIELNPALDDALDIIAGYVIDPSQPIPGKGRIRTIIDDARSIDPAVNKPLDEAQNILFDIIDGVNDVRDAIKLVEGLPGKPIGNGWRTSAGFGAALELRHHFLFGGHNAHWFIGGSAEAVAGVSRVPNPLPRKIINESNILFPYYGYEAVASTGLRLQLARSWGVTLSGNQPYSQYDVPKVSGILLEGNGSPYVVVSVDSKDARIGSVPLGGDVSIGVQYTPETETTRLELGLSWR